MNRRILFAVPLLITVVGCGASGTTSAQTTATSMRTKTYVDPNFGFRFSYPADWKAPKRGSTSQATGPNDYFVHLALPHQAAGMEVEVSGVVTKFPPIVDGEKRKDPSGPDIFTYYHARVSGYPALRVLRSYRGKVDEIATFINVKHAEYAVRTVIFSPPFPSWVVSGYNLVVQTLRIPARG